MGILDFGVLQAPKSHDALIEVFKFIRNKLDFCTYIEYEMLKIYFEVWWFRKGRA